MEGHVGGKLEVRSQQHSGIAVISLCSSADVVLETRCRPRLRAMTLRIASWAICASLITRRS